MFEVQNIMMDALLKIQRYRESVIESDPAYSVEYLVGAIEGQRTLELLYRGFKNFFKMSTLTKDEIVVGIYTVIEECDIDLEYHRDFSSLVMHQQILDIAKHNAVHRLKKRLRRILSSAR